MNVEKSKTTTRHNNNNNNHNFNNNNNSINMPSVLLHLQVHVHKTESTHRTHTLCVCLYNKKKGRKNEFQVFVCGHKMLSSSAHKDTQLHSIQIALLTSDPDQSTGNHNHHSFSSANQFGIHCISIKQTLDDDNDTHENRLTITHTVIIISTYISISGTKALTIFVLRFVYIYTYIYICSWQFGTDIRVECEKSATLQLINIRNVSFAVALIVPVLDVPKKH